MENLPVKNAMLLHKLLIAWLPGLLLGGILSGVICIEIFFEWLTWFTFLMTLSCIFLLYLVVPLLFSMYISQRTGEAEKGRETGCTISVIGMIIPLFATEILFMVYFSLYPPNQPMDFRWVFFVGGCVINLFGLLIAALGTIVGTILGVRLWKKRR